jgi:hypothetical protein
MEPNNTQLRLLIITYESGLTESILYDFDDHSGEILSLIVDLPESASFKIIRINNSLVVTGPSIRAFLLSAEGVE